MSTALVTTTAAGAVIVKVASQVTLLQLLVAVKVTVVLPPHRAGAPVLLFDKVPFDALAEASHDANAASTAAWFV